MRRGQNVQRQKLEREFAARLCQGKQASVKSNNPWFSIFQQSSSKDTFCNHLKHGFFHQNDHLQGNVQAQCVEISGTDVSPENPLKVLVSFYTQWFPLGASGALLTQASGEKKAPWQPLETEVSMSSLRGFL